MCFLISDAFFSWIECARLCSTKKLESEKKTAINLERKKWRNFSSFNLLIYRLSVRFVCTSALENSEHTKSHREIKSGRDLTRCCAAKKEESGRERDRKEKNSEAQKNQKNVFAKYFIGWLLLLLTLLFKHTAVVNLIKIECSFYSKYLGMLSVNLLKQTAIGKLRPNLIRRTHSKQISSKQSTRVKSSPTLPSWYD